MLKEKGACVEDPLRERQHHDYAGLDAAHFPFRALQPNVNGSRGTLVVLDGAPESGAPAYKERRATLESLMPIDAVFSGDGSRPMLCGTVVLAPILRPDSHDDALALYQRLRAAIE